MAEVMNNSRKIIVSKSLKKVHELGRGTTRAAAIVH